MTSQPQLSIVTAVLNRASFVRHAIESVIEQDVGDAIEHIVIDGGSTDGTLAILAEYPHLRVYSGPDRGVYDAMNKGIQLATGEFVALLNSDDAYPPGALRRVISAMAPGVEMIVGGARIVDATKAGRPTLRSFAAPPGLRMFDVTRGIPLTNARFFHRSLFERIGDFDATFRVAADRDWLIRACLAGIVGLAVDDLVYDYGHHPGSLTIGGADIIATNAEYLTIIDRYLAATTLNAAIERDLRDWRAQLMARNVRHIAGTAGFTAATRSAARYLREDVSWPLRAVVQRRRRPVRTAQDR